MSKDTLAKVKINLPDGRKKTVDFEKGVTPADVIAQIDELSGTQFTCRLAGQNLQGGSDVVREDMMDRVPLVPGDELTFTPLAIGG
jgi:hypothetical protein